MAAGGIKRVTVDGRTFTVAYFNDGTLRSIKERRWVSTYIWSPARTIPKRATARLNRILAAAASEGWRPSPNVKPESESET